MAGNVHTDSEALYAIRNAIIKFVDDIQSSQSNFDHCFESMNIQVEEYIRKLQNRYDELAEEKRRVNSQNISRQLDDEIKKIETEMTDVKSLNSSLIEKQEVIISLLNFDSSSDPDTTVSFIDKSISSIGDYNSVNFEVQEDSVKKSR